MINSKSSKLLFSGRPKKMVISKFRQKKFEDHPKIIIYPNMANGLTWWFLSMWLFVAWWFLSIHMINFKHSNVVFWTPEWWVFSMWLFVTWWKINMHMIKNHHTYDEKSTSAWWKIINLFVFMAPHRMACYFRPKYKMPIQFEIFFICF